MVDRDLLARRTAGLGKLRGLIALGWIDPPRARTLGIDCVTYSFRGAVNVTLKVFKNKCYSLKGS